MVLCLLVFGFVFVLFCFTVFDDGLNCEPTGERLAPAERSVIVWVTVWEQALTVRHCSRCGNQMITHSLGLVGRGGDGASSVYCLSFTGLYNVLTRACFMTDRIYS